VEGLRLKGIVAALLLLAPAGPALAESQGQTAAAPVRWQLSPWGGALLPGTQDKGVSVRFSAIPVQGKISSLFGPRRSVKRGASRLHKGIDISAPKGTPVKAVAPGLVIFQGRDKAYGKTIVLDHGNGLATRYAHLDGYAVDKGARVEAGQTIGAVGRTGRATGCNLHFETVIDGVPQNPLTDSFWLASLPKLETLPRLFAAGKQTGAPLVPGKSAESVKKKASASSENGIQGRGSSAPLAGVNKLGQNRPSRQSTRSQILP
jgi:murein DD-endopeptidase MepM/ murein hydrolase activator NlpD